MTVTQKKAFWAMPNGVKDVPYAPVKSILRKKKSIIAMQTSQLPLFALSTTIQGTDCCDNRKDPAVTKIVG